MTPLFFGVAHLHHLHEFVVHQRYPLAQALPVVRTCMTSHPLLSPSLDQTTTP